MSDLETRLSELAQRFDNVDYVMEARLREIMDLQKTVTEQAAVVAKLSQTDGGAGMSLMNDQWILDQCMIRDDPQAEYRMRGPDTSMIFPFVPAHVSKIKNTHYGEGAPDGGIEVEEKKISYGLSSFGYDLTLAPIFKIFTPVPQGDGHYPIIDPKRFDISCFIEKRGDTAILPPGSFMLAVTNERIQMPRDCTAICFNKSTYARCGINVATTVMEPGWHGQIVLEIANTTPIPARIYANEGIAQLMFFRGAAPLVDYGQRKGKYQGQSGVQEAL